MRIKDVFDSENFLFNYIEDDFIKEFDVEYLNILFISKYASLKVSYLVEMFVKNKKISKKDLDKIAKIVYSKYRHNWNRYYQVLLSKYKAIENYNLIEKEKIKDDKKSLEERGEINNNNIKRDSDMLDISNKDSINTRLQDQVDNITEDNLNENLQAKSEYNSSTTNKNDELANINLIDSISKLEKFGNEMNSNLSANLTNNKDELKKDRVVENEHLSVDQDSKIEQIKTNALGVVNNKLALNNQNDNDTNSAKYDKDVTTTKAFEQNQSQENVNLNESTLAFNNRIDKNDNTSTNTNVAESISSIDDKTDNILSQINLENNNKKLDSTIENNSVEKIDEDNYNINKSTSENEEYNNIYSKNQSINKTDNARILTRAGNIGVTTTQQMLLSEIELWRWNFIDEVFNNIKNEICSNIWEV